MSDVIVRLNGKVVNFKEQAPVISGDYLVTPLRGVFDVLGFEVEWNGNSEPIKITNSFFTMTFTLGVHEYQIIDHFNSIVRNLYFEVAPFVNESGRTVIPILEPLNVMGYKVKWNRKERTLDIKADAVITIKFITNNGSVGSQFVNHVINSTIPLPFPAYEGHVCMGWFNSVGERVGFAGDNYIVPSDNVTLTAQWKYINPRSVSEPLTGRSKRDVSRTKRIIFHHNGGHRYTCTKDTYKHENVYKSADGGGNKYHFMIDPEGDIWTGVPMDYSGAHTTGYNHDIGVALIGNFQPGGQPCCLDNPVDIVNENHKNTIIALSRYLIDTCNMRTIIVGKPDTEPHPREHAPIAIHNNFSPQPCPGDNARPWIMGELTQNIVNWLNAPL